MPAIHKHCDIYLLNQIHVCAYLDLYMQIQIYKSKTNNKNIDMQVSQNKINK